jgi:alpha-L-glutamate ligase-like protein/uncharacterized protein (TIGR02421 family)
MIFNSKGVLGINARNLLYLRPYNPTKAIKLADDKIKTKQFLSAREIPVPKLINMIRNNKELSNFDFASLPNQFVIKPNHGYGGEGIIPIIAKKDGLWITASGSTINKEDIIDHLQDILDGRFSISGVSDTAFFEQLIVSDETIGAFSYKGLPDIRVVVHNLIPVMAMLRLPTKASNGKANLHLGAVGVGIDIAKGEATHISHGNHIIDEIPDEKGKIRGLKIPHWDEILQIASRVQLITNLGYMAVDICLDKNMGPVLLEINARAGLGVQVANLAALRKRLERIEGIKVTTPKKGVRIAKDLFGNTVEKEIESISGKQIIGPEEEVEIIQKTGIHKLHAKIDTGKSVSCIDEETAQKIGLLDGEDYKDEKSTLKIKFALKGKRIQTIVDVEKIVSKNGYKMIIARRDLKNFLVDSSIIRPEKSKPLLENKIQSQNQQQNKNDVNLKKADHLLNLIDSRIKLLYHIRPMNFAEEKAKFFADPKNYNPQFEYPHLKFDPIEMVDELSKVKLDDSPFGVLFQAKKREVELKIELLESIDQENFTKISTELYGKPSEEEVAICKKIIHENNQPTIETDEIFMNAEEAKEEFEKVFSSYGLTKWRVKIKPGLVSACVAGKNYQLFLRPEVQISKKRLQSLIVHEIETHIITAENGKFQAYDIFNRGLANYLETQEGMAMYNVEQQTGKAFSKNIKAHTHVIAIHKAIKASFSEVYQELIKLGIKSEDAFRSALKAKRGFNDTSQHGAFTKDYIYFKGYHQVKKFIEEGGELKDLYIGKMNIADLELIKNTPSIRTAEILPIWLKR